MTGVLLIIGFPVISGLVFGVLYRGAALTPGLHAREIRRYNSVIYTALLAIPLAGVAFTPHGLSLADLGLRLPTFGGLPVWLAVVASMVGGTVVGYGLYRGEVAMMQQRAQRASGAPDPAQRTLSGRHTRRTHEQPQAHEQATVRRDEHVNYLMDGHTEETTRQMRSLPPSALLALTTGAILAEEVLWRGYLYRFLESYEMFPPAAALGLAALSFGSIHLHFGLRGAATKCIAGLAWGGLFLLTGSLLAPVASHLAFNVLALGIRIDWNA
jgi:membrane protease YdiL (CAAX protease family)